jgi:hypothetical protein
MYTFFTSMGHGIDPCNWTFADAVAAMAVTPGKEASGCKSILSIDLPLLK